MSEKKLTIVIPMYESEDYIERIIDSIYASNLPVDLFNVLVVNDGSTDKGPEIVEKLKKDHDNLQMVNRENGGLSVARNTGIEHSDSKYIWFVDADDLVLTDLSPIVEVLENDDDIDVFDFVFQWCYNPETIKGTGVTHQTVPHDVVISGRDAILKGYVPGSVCALLLRRDFLLANNLRFKPGLTQQDVELTYRMMAVAEKVLFKSNVIYNYVIRNGSISHTRTGEKWIKYQSDKVEIINSFYHLASTFKDTDSKLSKKIKRHADGALFGCVYSLYKKREKWGPMGVNKAVLAKLKENHLYPMKIPFYSLKKSLATMFLNIEYFIR